MSWTHELDRVYSTWGSSVVIQQDNNYIQYTLQCYYINKDTGQIFK